MSIWYHTAVQQNENILATLNNVNEPRSEASNYWLVPTVSKSCFGRCNLLREEGGLREALRIYQVIIDNMEMA